MYRVLTYLLSIAAIVAIAYGGSWALKKYKNRGQADVMARVEFSYQGDEKARDSFIEAESKLIRSERILGKIVDEFALNQLWSVSRSEALNRAREKFGIQKVEGADKIMFYYRDENPEVAMEILKSIIMKHQELQKAENKAAAEVMGAE